MAVKTVGYIGLGNAGAIMASCLAKAGFDLIVRDAEKEREEAFVKKNGNSRVAKYSQDGFQDAEVIITMLPNGKIVRDVMLGEKGYARGLKAGTIIVDTSSSSPYDTRALGAEIKELDLTLVDAPITQTHMHAIDTGDATIMVGSDSPEAIDKVMPVLQAMGKYIFPMGKLGAGHVMKTLNNYCSAASIMAVSDSLVTGQKFGLDPIQMIDVLNVGTGKSFPSSDTFASVALPRRYNSGYQLALLTKDIGIAQQVFQEVGFDTKLPGVIKESLDYSAAMLKPDADHTESLKGWEEKAGVQLRAGVAEGKTAITH